MNITPQVHSHQMRMTFQTVAQDLDKDGSHVFLPVVMCNSWFWQWREGIQPIIVSIPTIAIDIIPSFFEAVLQRGNFVNSSNVHMSLWKCGRYKRDINITNKSFASDCNSTSLLWQCCFASFSWYSCCFSSLSLICANGHYLTMNCDWKSTPNHALTSPCKRWDGGGKLPAPWLEYWDEMFIVLLTILIRRARWILFEGKWTAVDSSFYTACQIISPWNRYR